MMPGPPDSTRARVVGRYAIYGEIAAGGMATVHFGRLLGAVGFARTVAIKRLHPQFAKDPEFVSMFLDEARVAARIQHPNVVPTLDVVALEGELFIVMEYVQGESLARLLRAARKRGERLPTRVVGSILSSSLHGLHAAHEAKSERGEPLGIVHRDVSPQNILVGTDGVARVLDFGVAKAVGRLQTTREGQLKGKFAYMAPEQIRRGEVDRRTDIYAAAVVLWEALAGRRLVDGDNEAQILGAILECKWPAPSTVNPAVTKEIDAVVMRGLAANVNDRYATAREMAIAVERATGVASQHEIGEWVELVAHDTLEQRAARVKEIESISTVSSIDVGPQTPTMNYVPPQELASTPGATSGVASGISSTVGGTFDPAARRKSTTMILAAGGGLTVLLLLAAAIVAITRSGSETTATTTEATHATPAASEAPPAKTADAKPQPKPEEKAPPPTAASEPPPASESAPPPPAPAPPKHEKTTKPATAAPPPAPKPNCNPPYTIDASGIRKPKLECL